MARTDDTYRWITADGAQPIMDGAACTRWPRGSVVQGCFQQEPSEDEAKHPECMLDALRRAGWSVVKLKRVGAVDHMDRLHRSPKVVSSSMLYQVIAGKVAD